MKTNEDRDAAMCYIGRRPCGCVGFAAVDEPAHASDNAKEVAKVIRAGWTIERQSVQWVRENWGPGCEKCRPAKKSDKRAHSAAQKAMEL